MNLLRLKFLFFTSFILLPSQAFEIDYAKLQHAGEIGYYAFGIGKQFTEKYSLEIFHGVVPKNIGGERLETVAVKNNYHFYNLDFLKLCSSFYFGLSVYHVKGRKYQSSRRSSLPIDYYRIGSIRGLFYLGGILFHETYPKHSFYFESGLNDIVLINYYNNTKTVNPFDYVSLALGYKYEF